MDHISKDGNITGLDLETDQEKDHKSHNPSEWELSKNQLVLCFIRSSLGKKNYLILDQGHINRVTQAMSKLWGHRQFGNACLVGRKKKFEKTV